MFLESPSLQIMVLKNTMRLNYTTMSEEQIVKGVEILAEVIKKELNYACE